MLTWIGKQQQHGYQGFNGLIVIRHCLSAVVFFTLLLFSVKVLSMDLAVSETDAAYRGDGKALIGIAHRVIDRHQYLTTASSPNSQIEEPDSALPRWVYEVQFVMANSAAHQANLLPGDWLISWDGHHLDEVAADGRNQSLRNYLKQHKRVGEPLEVTIWRKSAWLSDEKADTSPTVALSQATLQSYLKHPHANQRRNLSIDYRVETLSKTLILGRRYDEVVLPDNDRLFAEMQHIHSPVEDSIQRVIAQLNDQAAYQDLLQRYEDNQKWQRGNRLNRFRYLHRQPTKVLSANRYLAEQLIHIDRHYPQQPAIRFAHQLKHMAAWLDITIDAPFNHYDGAVVAPTATQSMDINAHWQYIEAVLSRAESLRTQAFENLSESQRQTINRDLPALLQRFSDSFYINSSSDKMSSAIDRQANSNRLHQQNLTLLELLQKIDLGALVQATLVLNQLNDQHWHQQLLQHSSRWFKEQSVLEHTTEWGVVRLASQADHNHRHASVVMIDLGGDDRHLYPSQRNQSNVIIDIAGNDFYSASVHGAQASAFMGISLLYDWHGDDDYFASYFAQATAVAGVAILEDYQGDDDYWGQRYAQGSALWGLALLNDQQGDDRYHAWLYAQGFGGPMGIGVLLDNQGNDEYHATGESQSSYRTKGNFRSSSQGFAAGFRGYSSGGVGALVDAQGADQYYAGNFAMGTGYFYAFGILFDGGNEDDIFHASRYGMAASAHSAIGSFINQGGDDTYAGNHIALAGVAWDLSISAFWDQSGHDRYNFSANGFSLGNAAHNGYAVFVDSAGNDHYQLPQDYQLLGSNDYHGGSSFALVLDTGGEDQYPLTIQTNQQRRLQTTNGVMLDVVSEEQLHHWEQLPNQSFD